MHKKHMYIEHIDADEIKLTEIRKHIFGIILIYIQAFLGVVIAVLLAFFLLPNVLGESTGTIVANAFMVFTLLIAGAFLLGATIIYFQSRMIVTDRNITQVLQLGLFNRKVSQLTMENVEDVTALQSGFFATIFGFGILKIETAGEQVNFHFEFCPRPGHYAKIILDAREKYIEHNPNVHNGTLGAPKDRYPPKQSATDHILSPEEIERQMAALRRMKMQHQNLPGQTQAQSETQKAESDYKLPPLQ
jgi:uncharacterized membrane protein YdbT with pleckstrin-like domain